MAGNIIVKQIEKRNWNQLKEGVLIYELKIPAVSTAKKYKAEVEEWAILPKERQRSYYGSDKDNVMILRVSAAWSNAKGTVKVILAGKDYTAVFSREKNVDGYIGIKTPSSYEKNSCDVFDHIDVGTWLVCPKKYDGSAYEMEVAFISNESSIDNVKEILETVWYMHRRHSLNRSFQWEQEYQIESLGTITLKEVLLQKIVFNRTLRHFKWVKRKEQWDQWNSIKANISFVDNGTTFKTKVKALDGNTWSFESASKKVLDRLPEEPLSFDTGIYRKEWWVPFVYRKRGNRFLQQPNAEKTNQLMQYFLQAMHRLKAREVTFGFNKKTVIMTQKTTGNKARLFYLDGKIVKADNIREKVKDYFINSKPIVEEKVEVELSNGRSVARATLSVEAQKLIEEGLNGKMRDLEGEFPFHLNIIYKKEERKWYIECAGKLFYVKGGYGALKKIQSAARGTAVLDWDKYKDNAFGKSGTRVIRNRLAELVGPKDALWIVVNVKKMGALMKAIGPSV